MINKYHCSLRLALCFVFVLTAAAQAHSYKGSSYVFQHLTTIDGLSQSSITSILQDRTGYIWFGTSDGLNRFDGHAFKVFKHSPDDSATLSASGISALHESVTNEMWIGTSSGTVDLYNRKNDTFTSYEIPPAYDDNRFSSIWLRDLPIIYSRMSARAVSSLITINGRLIAGTYGTGLYLLDQPHNTFLSLHRKLRKLIEEPPANISGMVLDNQNRLWVASFDGGIFMLRFDGSEIEVENLIEARQYRLPGKTGGEINIVTLHIDRQGTLWAGALSGELLKYLPGEDTWEVINPPGERYPIMALTSQGEHLWLGQFGGGILGFHIANNSWHRYTHNDNDPKSLIDDEVISLTVDRSGLLWAGTHLGSGVSCMKKEELKFQSLDADETFEGRVVWTIHEDTKGFLWVGTYRRGLFRIDRETGEAQAFTINGINPFSISDNHIRSIAEDYMGNLWVGTFSGGLNRFDRRLEIFHRYKRNPADPHSLASNQVVDVYVAPDSTLWICAFGGGMQKLDLKEYYRTGRASFETYRNQQHNPSSISNNRPYCVISAEPGFLWVGTFGAGICKFDIAREEFIRYRHTPGVSYSLANDNITVLHKDSNGMIWVGTFGSGINRFDPVTGHFERLGPSDGITSRTIYGILEDKHGNLWVSADNGVFKLNPLSRGVVYYDLEDGLHSLEHSGGAYFRTDEGEMFFGGINGLNTFYPDSIMNDTYAPNVVITSITVLNKELPGEPESVTLSPDEKSITIEFAALDFGNPDENHYAYALEGIDKQWHYTGGNLRRANYSYLPAGSYTFLVKGTNADGIWSPHNASLGIIVRRSFWETWEFYAIVTFLALLLISFLVYYRIANLIAVEKLKAKLAADLHDNVGSGLTEIAFLAEAANHLVASSPDTAAGKMKDAADRARDLVDTMSDIVWMINPKRDSLQDFLLRLRDAFSESLLSRGISMTVTNLEALEAVRLPMDHRQQLYLIFKEALNNSIKHSGCNQIKLDAAERSGVIEITLRDNGSGFNNKQSYQGNGLGNMEQRAKLIGGRLSIRSSATYGTIVTYTGRLDARSLLWRRISGYYNLINGRNE